MSSNDTRPGEAAAVPVQHAAPIATPPPSREDNRSGEGAASALEHMLRQQLAHSAQRPRDDTRSDDAPPQAPAA
jgi:hypothetical protein